MGIDPYGSTEGSRIDGTLVSSFVSWDSKITTVVAMLGGVQDLVRDRMKSEGIYNEFKDVLKVCLSPSFASLAQAFCGREGYGSD